MFPETDIFNKLEFLVANIFAMFGGRVFQQTFGIPMGTNCVHLLADLFRYSYEANFIQRLLKKNDTFVYAHCIQVVVNIYTSVNKMNFIKRKCHQR